MNNYYRNSLWEVFHETLFNIFHKYINHGKILRVVECLVFEKLAVFQD